MKSKGIQDKQELKKIKLKLLLLGDAGVGKTSILNKYLKNKFEENYITTLGIESSNKTIKTNKFEIVLQIWDTAGQERFQSISKSYYNGSNGVIFVYDVTKKQSFEGLKSWINTTELYGVCEKIICGNKIDKKKREVSLSELKAFGSRKQLEVIEVSAKEGTNIDKVFRRLVDIILTNKTDEEIIEKYGTNKKTTKTLSLDKPGNKTKKDKCCKV